MLSFLKYVFIRREKVTGRKYFCVQRWIYIMKQSTSRACDLSHDMMILFIFSNILCTHCTHRFHFTIDFVIKYLLLFLSYILSYWPYKKLPQEFINIYASFKERYLPC